MSLRIRRGTDAQRATTPLDLGELVFTTDTKQLYVGNGIDNGGDPIIRLGTGLAWADTACTTIIATGAALQVSADATPSLGGDLTLSGHNITGTGNINITGNITVGVSNTVNVRKISADTGGLAISSTNTFPLTITGTITGGATGQLYVSIRASKGTVTSPTTTVAGDNLGGIVIAGYNGTSYRGSGVISTAWEAGAVLSETLPKTTLTLSVAGGGTTLRSATFNSSGVFNAPILNTTTYSAAGTAIPSAATSGIGARAFVIDATVATFGTAYTSGGSNSVPVYSDGTSWFVG